MNFHNWYSKQKDKVLLKALVVLIQGFALGITFNFLIKYFFPLRESMIIIGVCVLFIQIVMIYNYWKFQKFCKKQDEKFKKDREYLNNYYEKLVQYNKAREELKQQE